MCFRPRNFINERNEKMKLKRCDDRVKLVERKDDHRLTSNSFRSLEFARPSRLQVDSDGSGGARPADGEWCADRGVVGVVGEDDGTASEWYCQGSSGHKGRGEDCDLHGDEARNVEVRLCERVFEGERDHMVGRGSYRVAMRAIRLAFRVTR